MRLTRIDTEVEGLASQAIDISFSHWQPEATKNLKWNMMKPGPGGALAR